MSTSNSIPMEQPGTRLAMHPKKFALWLFIVSIFMLFAAYTSAYIVKASEGITLDLTMPSLFKVSTLTIILSSVSMQWSYHSAKVNDVKSIRLMLVITSVLGLTFLVTQFLGWGQLVDQNIYFSGSNALASFVYIFTGLHGVHLIGGVIFLMITLVAAFQYKIHSKSMVLIEMCATYWHFLGGLWLYLFLFLTVNLN